LPAAHGSALGKRQRLAVGDGEDRKSLAGRSDDTCKPQAFESEFGCRFAFGQSRWSPSRVEKRHPGDQKQTLTEKAPYKSGELD
jgi:hypothetical protein